MSSSNGAASLEALNRALDSLARQYQGAGHTGSGEILDQLVAVANRRRELLAASLEDDPAAILRHALPEGARRALPGRVQDLIEQEVVREGELEVVWEDATDASRLRHFLLDDRGGRRPLHFAGEASDLPSGARVRVRGVEIESAPGDGDEGGAVVAYCCNGSGVETLALPELPNTFGEQRTLVLLVNYEDRPDEPLSLGVAEQLVFGSVSDFFMENSSEQTWLAGDVHGWFTVAVDSTSSCPTDEIQSQVDAAAALRGIDLSAYDRYVYVLRRADGCRWSGRGTVGGRPSRAWTNGWFTVKTIGHELGHNLGLYHSHGLSCGETTLGSDCQKSEYGDSFDIMGTLNAGHLNAFQKQRLGWLDFDGSPPITRVERDGSYRLETYELASDGPKALQIPKGVDPTTGEWTWYYLEYRQPIGFDSFLEDPYWDDVVNGVVVRLGTDANPNSSFLLDMLPLQKPGRALETGASFSDPDAGVTFTTVSTDSGSATVTVDFGGQVCLRADPALTVSPFEGPQVEAGTPVTYDVALTNHDSSSCGPSTFSLRASIPDGWSAAFANPRPTLDAGASETVSLSVTSTNSAPDGMANIEVTAENEVDRSYASSAAAIYQVAGGPSAPVNQPPTAVADSASTKQATPVVIDVLANDFDPDGDRLAVAGVTQSARGRVTLNGDGTVTYTPDGSSTGDDSFSYVVTDGTHAAGANVSVSVRKRNSGKAWGRTKR